MLGDLNAYHKRRVAPAKKRALGAKQVTRYFEEREKTIMKRFVPRDVHLAALISNASYKNTDEEIRDSLGTIGNRSLYLDPVVVKDSGWYGTGIWKERKCILTVHKRQFDGRLTLVITFRGTNDKWDGLADLKYDQQDVTIGSVTGKVHTGFYDRYMEYQKNVKAEVDVIIKSLADKNTPVDEMIITGHSLGGAVATICYIDLYQKYSNQFKVFCITFGQRFEIVIYDLRRKNTVHVIYIMLSYVKLHYTLYFW